MLHSSFIFNRDKLKHYDFMKHQQVVIDYTNMLNSSMTCVMLAFFGWVLIKLIQAIFMMPGYLDKEEKRLALEEEQRKRDEQKKSDDDQNAKVTDATGEEVEILPNEKDVTKLKTDEVKEEEEKEDDDDDEEEFEESTGEPLVEKKTK